LAFFFLVFFAAFLAAFFFAFFLGMFVLRSKVYGEVHLDHFRLPGSSSDLRP
jgi:hypothetical protein